MLWSSAPDTLSEGQCPLLTKQKLAKLERQIHMEEVYSCDAQPVDDHSVLSLTKLCRPN